jgi:hypothetical protein
MIMETKDFKHYFKAGLEILQIKQNSIKKIAEDSKATTFAILFIALAGVASAIGTLNLVGIIFAPVAILIGTFIWFGILHLFSKIFGGKGKYSEFYRAAGVGYVGMWLAVIPILGPFLVLIISLWYLVVYVNIVKVVHKLSTGKAIAVVAIPVAIITILAFVVGMLVAAFLYTFLTTMNGGELPPFGV